MYEHGGDEKLYSNPKNKNDGRMILRDLMWKFSNWYNSDLKKWLDREAPSCIFVAPGPATFLYDIALKISNDRNIPIISYVCDDYYFVKPSNTILGKIRLSALKRKIRELMKQTSKAVVISDSLKNEYAGEFLVPAEKLMTGSSFIQQAKPDVNENPFIISYFGNIRCDRFRSLADVGIALDNINDKKGTDFRLDIYTSEKDPNIIGIFDGIKSVKLCPFVSAERFREALLGSHILLHVEAFDEKSIDTVKFSVSTKIADSLACGIPLFAYAPAEVSSMEHLIKNECAMTATSNDELEEMLLKAFFDKDLREKTVAKAQEVAKEYHDDYKNSDLLRQIFMEAEKANDESFTRNRI
jgi:hypothetical protein